MQELIKRYTLDSIKNMYRKLRSAISSTLRPYRDAHALRAVMKLAVQKRESQTSISDDGYYPLVCYLASKHESIFRDFRRNRIYNQIVGEPEDFGYRLVHMIEQNSYFSPTAEDWKIFQKSDLYGNPQLYTFNINHNEIKISVPTLHYVKVLGDIISMFDYGNIRSIAEIGVGYGGQCRIIMSHLPVMHYSLFDLPEVLGLDERYLAHYDECIGKVRYIDGGHIYVQDEYDLVISNYAFCELRREVQDIYIEKVISKSKRGYMTWNIGAEQTFNGQAFNGYTMQEFLKAVPGSSIIEVADEYQFTATGIVIWGNK